MGHTKEPWYCREIEMGETTFKGPYIDIHCRGRKPIFDSQPAIAGGADSTETRANAERIVTCINAMKGLTNDEVKRYGPEIRLLHQKLNDSLNIMARCLVHVFDIKEPFGMAIHNDLEPLVSEVEDILDRIEKEVV